MISAPQLRAARAWLDWTRNDCAKASGISAETIKNIEHDRYRPRELTHHTLEQCFRRFGIEFTGIHGLRRLENQP